MKAHHDLFALHAALKAARRNADTFQYDSHGHVLLLPLLGVIALFLGFISPSVLSEGFAYFCFIAGVFCMLGTPIPVYLERRKRKMLAADIHMSQTNYLNALHAVLDAKGYKGEYLSENDPSSSEYRCIAIKDGAAETVHVKAMHDGMLISSRRSMLALV